MKKYAIIVAGGKGLRMGGDVPKQFIPLKGRPVLMRTLEAFYGYDQEINLILVLPEAQQEYWRELCKVYHFTLPYRLANGGETRFHSVKNGLQCVPDEETEGLVAVHDGVRPFIRPEVLRSCYDMAQREGAVVPVIDVIETLRHLKDHTSYTVNREDYKLVQTPQVFKAGILKKAYAQPYSSCFTDDASVVETLGLPVNWVQGNRENIKITTPFDLKIAEAILTGFAE